MEPFLAQLSSGFEKIIVLSVLQWEHARIGELIASLNEARMCWIH